MGDPKPLYEKKVFELGNDVIEQLSVIRYTDLKEWAIAIVKECCPEETPYSLGASPSRCDVCEFLIDRFELTEEELKYQQ